MINTAFSVPLPFQTMPQTDTSGMAQSFMQAYQIAKEQNDPLHKLRIATYEQDMQMKSLELSKALEDRQKTIDSEKRARDIAPTISGLLSAGKPYDAHMAILSETAKNPDLQFAPTWQGLGKSVGAAVTYQDKLEDNKRQAERDAAVAQHYRDQANIDQAKVGIEQQRAEAYASAEGSKKDYYDTLNKNAGTRGGISGDAIEVKAPDGTVVGYQVQGVRGPHFTPARGNTAPIQNFEYRMKLQNQANEAEDAGDYEKADELRSSLRQFDAANPSVARAARLPEAKQKQVQSLYTRINQLNAARVKLSPDQQAERARMMFEIGQTQKQIDDIVNPGAAQPPSSSATESAPAPNRFILDNTGKLVPKK